MNWCWEASGIRVTTTPYTKTIFPLSFPTLFFILWVWGKERLYLLLEGLHGGCLVSSVATSSPSFRVARGCATPSPNSHPYPFGMEHEGSSSKPFVRQVDSEESNGCHAPNTMLSEGNYSCYVSCNGDGRNRDCACNVGGQ